MSVLLKSTNDATIIELLNHDSALELIGEIVVNALLQNMSHTEMHRLSSLGIKISPLEIENADDTDEDDEMSPQEIIGDMTKEEFIKLCEEQGIKDGGIYNPNQV